MHHGRVGHSCDGLIRQACSHPVSRVFSIRGLLSLQGDCHYLFCPIVGIDRYILLDFILVRLGSHLAVLHTNLPRDMRL